MDSSSLHIQRILGIDLPLAQKISAICRPVTYPANTTIQSRGAKDSKGIFLLKGVCKYSIFDGNGNEYVSHIDHAECFLAYAFLGFYRKDYAMVNFISISEIEGLVLKSVELMPIMDKNPQLYLILIDIMLRRHQLIQTKEISIIQKTSTERYQDFLENHKGFLDLIPLKDIAKYLNIKPGSLSRIRKKTQYLI